MGRADRIPDFEMKLDELARRWAQDPEIAAAWLHGSRARGTARPNSDVDLAVALRAGLSSRERWNKRLALLDQATARFGTDAVDLVILEEATSPLAHRVIRDGRRIVDSDPRRRVEVVEDVFRRYLDEAWLRRELDEGLHRRLAEQRFAR